MNYWIVAGACFVGIIAAYIFVKWLTDSMETDSPPDRDWDKFNKALRRKK